ncbi:helix-turn-helix domain-containing protein [Dyadobacter sp. BHUBP1]|uniref:helix-turn-helix domain-containing protein n=1 Tax=Dyadobacter sp. BHUBP1 TaxID=3424178 RepID=UPI003D341777
MDNWKAIVYLLAFGQGFVLSLSLIVKGINGKRASLFLGLMLLVLSQELLNAWAMQVHYHSRPDAIPFWNLQSYLLLAVATWFFVRLSTEPGFVFNPRHVLFFVPVVVEIAIRCTWQAYRRFTGIDLPSLLENPAWFFLTELLPIIGMIGVLGVYACKLQGFYRSWKKKAVSLSLPTRFRVYGLFGFLVVLTSLWIAGVILDWPVFFGIEVLLTLCLFGLGYAGYVTPEFFMLPVLPKEKPTERPDFARFDDQVELQKLKYTFMQDRLYTRSGLTLDDVAAHLQLPPRYISYLINTYFQTNFNGYVNSLRVEEVIRKLADPAEQHKTILGLALDAGFSSKSTFNQVFKQHTSKSPSEFLLVQK